MMKKKHKTPNIIVKPLKEQLLNESRKVWHKLTVAIRDDNMEKAFEAKFEVEEKERNIEKNRKEKGEEFKPSQFENHELLGWIYKNHLLDKKISSKKIIETFQLDEEDLNHLKQSSQTIKIKNIDLKDENNILTKLKVENIKIDFFRFLKENSYNESEKLKNYQKN